MTNVIISALLNILQENVHESNCMISTPEKKKN